MHKGRMGAAFATAALALGMAACGGEDEAEPAAGGGGGGGESAAVAKPADIKVGVVLKTFANDYWTAMRDGVNDKAKELGVPVKVDAAASESGTEEQVSKLEAMTSAQYDCYAVAPITATNLLQPLVPIAQEKGAIVNLDAPIGTKEAEQAGVAPATFIASNHGQAGVLGAEHMAEVLGDKAQGAEIVLVGGIAGDATSNARTKGFQDTAAQSGMKIAQTGNADWDRDKALTLAGDILRARPNVSGFFAANDTMALGIQQAVQNAGKEDQVTVIGVDGAEQALQSIERGGMAATVAQYPYAVGALGVEACVAQVQGKDLPKTIESPLAVVTKENVSKALASYPKPFETVENPIAELIER